MNSHAVIDAQGDAYRKRDLKTFASFYSADIKVYRNGELIISGIDALRSAYKEIFDLSPDLELEISERRIEGEYVHDTELITGLRGNFKKIVAQVRYKLKNEKIEEVIIHR